jgi:integral membrane protein
LLDFHGAPANVVECNAMNIMSVLRVSVWLEGASYLVLLLVAVPLKYSYGLPMATRVAGGVHGILFLGFLVVLYQTHLEYSWTKRHTLSLLAASLIPGSVWWLDSHIRVASEEPKVDN